MLPGISPSFWGGGGCRNHLFGKAWALDPQIFLALSTYQDAALGWFEALVIWDPSQYSCLCGGEGCCRYHVIQRVWAQAIETYLAVKCTTKGQALEGEYITGHRLSTLLLLWPSGHRTFSLLGRVELLTKNTLCCWSSLLFELLCWTTSNPLPLHEHLSWLSHILIFWLGVPRICEPCFFLVF
jgi:hypothetical protein